MAEFSFIILRDAFDLVESVVFVKRDMHNHMFVFGISHKPDYLDIKIAKFWLTESSWKVVEAVNISVPAF